MSYILDALRKADAQRERDPARGIHAQAAAAVGEGGRPPAGGRWVWAVAGLVVLGLAAGGWWVASRGARPVPAGTVAVAQAPAQPPQPSTPTPPAAQVQAPVQAPPVAQAVPPAVQAQPGARVPPTGEAPASVPPIPALPRPAVAPVQRGAAPAPASAATAGGQGAPGTVMAQPGPAGGPSRGTAQAQPVPQPAGQPQPQGQAQPQAVPLPADAPRVVVSGGVYSADPSQRMLIANGQVFNEGSEIAAGVRLVQIQPRTAVLEFRGGRYTVAY